MRSWEPEEVLVELGLNHGPTTLHIIKDFEQRLAGRYWRSAVTVRWRGSKYRKDEHATLWPWIEYDGIFYYPPIGFRVDGKVEVPFRTVGRVPERWNNHHLFKNFRTPFDKEDKRRELRDRLNGIPRIKLNSISLNGRPSFSLSLLEDRDTFDKLVEVFGWYVDEIVTGPTRLPDAGIEAQVQSDLDSLKAEEEEYFEGQSTQRFTRHYERNKNLRAATIKHHGVVCKVCGFDFEEVYGERGKDFIEAHHLIPVSSLGKETSVDPKRDMTVLCSNCHRMIHRRKDDVLTPKELKSLLRVGFESWAS